MPFIIRVQTSQGMARFSFENNNATFEDLQKQIKEKYGVNPTEQVLSYDAPTKPRFIECKDPKTKLTKL